MELTYQTVLQAALRLSNEERYELIDELTASLDPEEQAAVDAAWAAEIKRRLQEFKEGKTKGVPWSEVREMVRRRSQEIDAGTAQLIPWSEVQATVHKELEDPA